MYLSNLYCTCPNHKKSVSRQRRNPIVVIGLMVAITIFSANMTTFGQDNAGGENAIAGGNQGANGGFVRAISLLPENVAGLLRIPHLPDFCDAWPKTHFGKLVDDPLMQPFIEEQRTRVTNYLDSLEERVGLKPQDIFDIASGEVVVAWLPFEKDKRRPFAICVVADIRGNRAKADKALEQIDLDLIAGGATRKDSTYRGENVRVYTTKPKPGQIKIEEIAITLNDSRIIAADRDSVVTDLLDAVAGEPKGKSISELAEFQDILSRASREIKQPILAGNSTIALEWFGIPFQMGRILREAFNVDRGNRVDILNLLENQGFDALRAAGGIVAIAGKKFDILHRGFVFAPPTTTEPSKYEKAARMMQFVDSPNTDIPEWISASTASLLRIHLKIEDAFWASESLINEAFGDDIFAPMIEGIRDDSDGPRIDLKQNVLPGIGNEILLATDNILPADVQSERMLVAIAVKDFAAIQLAVRKAMEVEPDSSKMDVVPGVEVWRVQRGEAADDFENELFGDLGFEEEDIEEAPPLLDHWAIAVVQTSDPNRPAYLMFSSHPELLVETVKRVKNNVKGGFDGLPEVKHVIDAMKELGAKKVAASRIVRTKLSLRVKYELFRQGKLKDSDSVLATVIRRIFAEPDGEKPEPINAAKLPPLQQIEKYLPEGGNYFETKADGWSMTGFYLK